MAAKVRFQHSYAHHPSLIMCATFLVITINQMGLFANFENSKLLCKVYLSCKKFEKLQFFKSLYGSVRIYAHFEVICLSVFRTTMISNPWVKSDCN
jgi:hypothetical protein